MHSVDHIIKLPVVCSQTLGEKKEIPSHIGSSKCIISILNFILNIKINLVQLT